MKIWLLTSEFPPLYGGGISTYCVESAKMFSKFGHEVTIITPDWNVKKLTIEERSSYKIARFNPDIYYTASFLGHETHLSFCFAEAVKDSIQQFGYPDVIESQEYLGIAYYILQYKWLQYPIFKDLKILITLHAPSFLYLEYNKVSYYQHPYFWIGEMERYSIRAADLVISPSNYLVNELKKRMKLDDIKIHLLKNPYDLKHKFIENKITKNKCMFFGKLTPQKGCLELIEYCKELWNEGFEYSLYMIGGGEHLYHPEGIDMIDFINNRYKNEIKTDKLKLLGSVEPTKIINYLKDAHIVIVPSIVDNLPYTVLEAMGEGKVVLASIQGGQSEIITNSKNGFLFNHGNSDSFKNQLNLILSLSDNELKMISYAAFSEIKHTYSYESIYAEKINLLNNLISINSSTSVFPFIRPISVVDKITHSGERNLLSIIIPYYNMGSYIKETLISIKKSSYKKIEVIIVNDGSTEKDSIEILPLLEKEYSLTIINKKNQGLALARNTGALYANGEYIAILDPDDTIEDTYYEKAINILSKYDNIYFIGCWAKYFGDASGYWPAFNPEPPYLLVHNMVNSSALIFKRPAFLNAGQNDPKMIYGMEDYDSVINLVKNGYQGVILPEPLWNYRIRKNSMARSFTKEKQIYLYSLIAHKHRDFYAIFASQITNLLNANGPGINYDNPTQNYNLLHNKWINLKLKQFIIKKLKANKRIRKVSIQLINFYKNK